MESICTVCQRPCESDGIRTALGALRLCRLCGRSLDELNRRDLTHAALIAWAAQRGRRFAAKSTSKPQRCRALSWTNGARCELPKDHDGKHDGVSDGYGRVVWGERK